MKNNFIPKIKVFSGTMFSGKTTALINEMERYELADIRTVLFKPNMDTRYSKSEVVNHNGVKMMAIPIETTGNFSNIITIVEEFMKEEDVKVVCIDEIQFFESSIVGVIEYLVNVLNVSVMVAGLDMDYLGRPFGPVPQLLAIADDVQKFKAVCRECGNDGIFEYRISKDDDSLVQLGSTDKYIPLCRHCYNKKYEETNLL